MSKKHLTYDDRLAIQAGLQKGLKVAQIARNIGKDRATIGREIKAHRRLVTTSGGNNCIHHKTCTRIPDCRSGCHRGKRQCQTACGGCQKSCPEYREEFCSDYERSPFVCNPCDHGSAAGCAVCSMTQSMPRSNTRRPFRSPAGESP